MDEQSIQLVKLLIVVDVNLYFSPILQESKVLC